MATTALGSDGSGPPEEKAIASYQQGCTRHDERDGAARTVLRREREEGARDRPTLTAIHHVSINVHDLDRSERWYTEVLQFSRLVGDTGAGFQRVLLHHPSGIALALNKYDHPDADTPFSERRTGLNHLAFQVADRGQLEVWIARFDALGVVHSEFKPAPIPGSFGIMFRDPDNIQLEVFAPAQGNP